MGEPGGTGARPTDMSWSPAAAATIAALLATLSGCTSTGPTGAEPTATGTPPTATPAPATTTPTAAASPTTAPPETPTPGTPATAARVVLVRAGGIAGMRDTVTVEPDGRWTRADRAGGTRTGRLSTTDQDRLQQLLADPRLGTETTATADPGDCADAFAYRLTVGDRTTGYVDCDAGPARPPATEALVRLLIGVTG
ncbi:protealysin inhibitor emfourin [Micromonospora coerulea]|uniref:protealysin inhibitor emfourin n=1 Tax=Micromonospora coerulea TaxID=47856 RepID=UPI0019040FB3|nr:protealysin inhibitor emfourin [Micromonospora veneta]